MQIVLIDIFDIEKTCEYRGDTYRVRDNGALYRERRYGVRIRPLDEKWVFGNVNKQTRYLTISTEVVHRIVATAFHGKQPSEKHIVDHIDTNRQNNRAENLRWVTRLENLLLNPITLSRILRKYGNLDNFFSNPSKPLKGSLDQNFDWMRTVTKVESENTITHLLNLARNGDLSRNGTLGVWVFGKLNSPRDSKNTVIQSITPNAIQKKWKIASEFPNCPVSVDENDLNAYHNQLTKGVLFSDSKYGQSEVIKSDIYRDTSELIVLTTNKNLKPYALARVFIEKNKFTHENCGSFFELNGAQKQFNLSLGLPWEGEDSIDDYC